MHLYKKIIDSRFSFIRVIPIFLVCLLLLTSCQSVGSVALVDQFGTYGGDFARNIASNFPSRVAGSEQEHQVADTIAAEFKKYGYTPEIQEFSLPDGGTSKNIIVRIPGNGFIADETLISDFNYSIYEKKAKPEEAVFRRQVIIAARYDSDPNAPAESDGISDNASGLGALMLTAQTLKRVSVGYDVVLVALGGGFSNYAGARNYLAQMSEAEKQITDTFYEYRSLYSGGKLYGHAGFSSLNPKRKYALRQPLYAVADTAIDVQLLAATGIAFYTNQSIYLIPNPLASAAQAAPQIPFREISKNRSDYKVFDDAGIPIVYFESYDYSADKYDEIIENVDPSVASTNYLIRGTGFDNQEFLKGITKPNFLDNRINSTVYLVITTLQEGVLGSK